MGLIQVQVDWGDGEGGAAGGQGGGVVWGQGGQAAGGEQGGEQGVLCAPIVL